MTFSFFYFRITRKTVITLKVKRIHKASQTGNKRISYEKKKIRSQTRTKIRKIRKGQRKHY